MRTTLTIVAIIAIPSACLAWNGHEVTEGDLKILIEEVDPVTRRDAPVDVTVSLTNSGDEDISGTLEARGMVDDSRVVGDTRKPFEVAAGETVEVVFQISFGARTYSALYPVHVDAEFGGLAASAVRIVKTQFATGDTTSDGPTEMETIVVPREGAVGLWTVRSHRVAWNYYDGPARYKPAGWMGSDEESRASIGVRATTRGDTRPAINMHPPWQPGGGTIFADYLLELPDTEKLTVKFATAIRDSSEGEPLSDGVQFRVWAAEDISGANAELLYDNFTDAKVWEPGEADLRNFAGQTILLRLESHPGPARNTTCDSCYWAEPMVVAGDEPEDTEAFAGLDEGLATAKAVLNGARPDGKLAFLLGPGDDPAAAVIVPTERGIIDGTLVFAGGDSTLAFDGFALDIMRQSAVRWPTSIGFAGYEVEMVDGRARHVHHLVQDGLRFDLTATVWAEGPGLRIAFDCPERITDFALGAANQTAPVVYYGHGYRIENPKGFRAGFGGHNLSTSHVGCDFEGGMSLLQATDTPPNYFDVSPPTNQYSLHSHMNGMLTLVPSTKGAMDCAIRYRPLYDKQPASGVEKLAGRMCFDIWGGRYADDADSMAEMIKYGLTDSFITKHVWQRWGYDYRLPDIWPPSEGLGTVEDMQRLGDVCRAAEIPWGLHDNYIDFYPDADDYSYGDICFTESGQPVKAWINEGREAQSYRWRPDRFEPFMKRNLKLIKDGCAPDHFFIDVFTSIGCIDFYDWDGKFHPSTETREKWGETFAWIRDYLGDDSPQTSEAGHDQLTGYLDGADCQHLELVDEPVRHAIALKCDDWERVPWYDAVLHDKFILHGVGYSGRYQNSRSRAHHGITSDDYISAEVLTGHALMVDAGCWGRPAVRKYWLAQDVARQLALKNVEETEYVDGDMHRQRVTWSDGTIVHVNRGDDEWTVDGHVLPKYGYLAQADGLESSIEMTDGTYSEKTIGASGWYCNARTYNPSRRVQIQPRLENVDIAGDTVRWDVVWDAQEPAPRDMRIFGHFYDPDAGTRNTIAFQDDHDAPTPTSQWDGEIRYSRTVTVPEDADGEYVACLGMYDQRGRLPLMGPQSEASQGGDAIWVGTITVRRDVGRIAEITFAQPPEPEPLPEPRVNLAKVPLDFGFAVTDGAFRVRKTTSGLTLTPLPDGPGFDVTLRLAEFGLRGAVASATAIADDGAETPVDFREDAGTVSFRVDGEAFAYEIGL